MLSTDALNSAMPLATVLDAADLKLVPITGTPLDKLVLATRSDDNFSIADGDGYTPSIVDIQYIANAKDEVLGGSPHDFAMDNITADAVAAVQGHINFARSVVAPAVTELVEKTQQTLAELTPSVLLGMEVVVWEPAAPLQNPGIESLVRRFESVPFAIPPLNMRMPNLSVSEITELMQSGSRTLDGDVEIWLAGKGESFLIGIWENVFQMKQAELHETTSTTFRDFVEDKINGADNALAIFLLARRLVDNPLPGSEMSVNAFNDLVAEFRDQAGARVCRELDIIDGLKKSKTLVKSINGTTTVVHASVYKSWIDAGGSNEILFGNMLELPASVTVDMLNEKAEALKSKWQRHAAVTATLEANRKFLRTKDTILRHFTSQIREVGDDGFEAATTGNREGVLGRFRDLLGDLNEDDLKDLWGSCLKLICRSRFSRTEAERILGGIERIKRDNPTIDVREAAAVSVIEYVAFWLASQFKVESAK